MTITIGTWIVPTLVTVALLCVMFRPYHRSGQYDFGEILRLFWLLPICAVWVAWMAIMLLVK